ncbi:MAG: quinone-dependent dihydroorotate dehydrogenase [Deltaproteobacteria bacterium]|nr:quinone-dependent dihydroorotate dehydrogenase [Deltaproteobacteria bacterium]
MYALIKPLFFRTDPEDAHERMMRFIRTLPSVPGGLALVRAVYGAPALPVDIGGLRLRNPVGLAAGFDKNAEAIPALAALGFGFLEVGTLTRRPQPGNPRPRMFRYPALGAVVNRLGFNNVGVEEAARTLERVERPGIPIGINVGKNATTSLEDAPAEYAECIRILLPYGDYFTLNISSPNTQDLRKLHENDRLQALFDAVLPVMGGKKPLFLKLSPDAEPADLENAARMAADRGVGLICTNTTVDRTGLETLEKGGLSGAPLTRRSTETLKRVLAAVDGRVPVIGVGGIMSPADALEKMNAGAAAVQVYTGLIYRGPGFVRELVNALGKEDGWRKSSSRLM